MKPLVQSLLEARYRDDSRAAVLHKRGSYWVKTSWREYYEYVSKIAAGLISHGLKVGERVAIMSNTRFEWISD